MLLDSGAIAGRLVLQAVVLFHCCWVVHADPGSCVVLQRLVLLHAPVLLVLVLVLLLLLL
jgi:hypothetical protein